MVSCPFCNIRMYRVIDEDYPKLDTYLCYECGFHADTILMDQKPLFQQYQALFAISKHLLKPRKIMPIRRSDDNLQSDEDEENRRRLDRTSSRQLLQFAEALRVHRNERLGHFDSQRDSLPRKAREEPTEAITLGIEFTIFPEFR